MENKDAIHEDKDLIHEFSQEKPKASFMKNPILIFSVIIIAGITTGFFVAKANTGGSVVSYKKTTEGSSEAFKKGDIVGIKDDKLFRDSAEGELKAGGIDGEGAFHLERPGGESQYVYLTSSTIDLSIFVGKKVKIWGQTNTAQKAGWLMDVGRLQIL